MGGRGTVARHELLIAFVAVISAAACAGPSPPPRTTAATETKRKDHPEWFIQADWTQTVSGRFEFEDGRAAPGVTYSLLWIDHPPDAPSWWNPRSADARGRFRVDDVSDGRFVLEIYPPWEEGDLDVAPAISTPFDAGEGDVVIRVRPGRHLSGVVVTTGDRPVDGAEVEVRPDPILHLAEIRLQTAADGSFSTRSAAHGPVYIHVDARDVGEGRRERYVADIGPLDPSEEPIRVEIDRGLVLSGRLTESDGSPKADVCLVAIPPGEIAPLRDDRWNGCRTDSDGQFAIRGLAPGRYQIWAMAWRSPFFRMYPYVPSALERFNSLNGETGAPAGTTDIELTWPK